MLNFLQQDAHDHIWGSPRQDTQYIFKLGRITQVRGSVASYNLNGDILNMPDTVSTWHIFNIGQMNPNLLNLNYTETLFKDIVSSMEEDSLFIDCYNESGIQVFKSDIYYNFTYEKDLIFAIRQNSLSKINLKTDDIWMRFYKPSIFTSDLLTTVTKNIQVFSKNLSSNAVLLEAKKYHDDKSNLTGDTLVYKDGYLTNIDNIKIFDNVDIVYDASIKKIVELNYGEINTYVSVDTNNKKYVLHTPAAPTQLDYYDDVDVYIVGYDNSNNFVGLLYSRNDADSIKQLTFKDYSIKTTTVENLINLLGPDLTFKIRLILRNSGSDNVVYDERRRLVSLYDLNETSLKSTLGGIDSNISIWDPVKLENSTFSKFVGTTESKLQFTDMDNLYGYYTDVYRSKQTIVKIVDTNKDLLLPISFNSFLTAYEYDKDGYLIDSYAHEDGVTYNLSRSGVDRVELISGIKKDSLVYYTSGSITLEDGIGYRVYLNQDGTYTDVTDLNIYQNTENGILNITPNGKSVIVKTNKYLYEIKRYINYNKGELSVELDPIVEVIPFGQIDVFMNGRILVEDIDYILAGNKVFITRNSYSIKSESQDVLVRMYGFCNSDMTRTSRSISGIVKNGTIDLNGHYELIKYRLLKVSIDGYLLDYTADDFKQYNNGTGRLNDGSVYGVSPYMQNIDQFTKTNSQALSVVDDENDKIVTDYITSKNKLSSDVVTSSFTFDYISAFMVTVINSLLKTRVIRDNFYDNYNEYKVIEYCKQFEYVLQSDKKILSGDFKNNVTIYAYPTQITVDLYTYKFINVVNKIYYSGLVDVDYSIITEVI